MGLDMYLTARKYLSDFQEDDKKIVDLLGSMPIGRHGLRIRGVEAEAIYWRKANAIHNWFVNNVQNGEDECKEHYVTRDQLEELHDLCVNVIKAKTKDAAIESLPPIDGFFFGGTDIDEYYWQDLEYTRDKIREILENPGLKDWDFYYQSSW